MKWLSSLVPLLLCAGIAGSLPRVPPLDGSGSRDECAGPFPSWVNVQTQHGAVGDGLADDSAALQKAFGTGNWGRADIFAAANLREEVPMPVFTNPVIRRKTP